MIVIHQLKNRVMLESHKNSMVPNHQPDFYLMDPMVGPGTPSQPRQQQHLEVASSLGWTRLDDWFWSRLLSLMGSNGFQWISIDLTCWSMTCRNMHMPKLMEFNHESYGTKLERHFTSRIVINNKRSKEPLGIYPQWIMNLNPQNGWFLDLLGDFFLVRNHVI